MSGRPRKRIDPKSRPNDIATGTHSTDLINRDPDRHYVFISREDPTQIEYYEHLGYDIEMTSEGGVRVRNFRRKRENGAPVEWRGAVLMSCSMERKREIDMYGEDGNTGQALVDKIESRMRIRKDGRDPMRGLLPPRLDGYIDLQSIHRPDPSGLPTENVYHEE